MRLNGIDWDDDKNATNKRLHRVDFDDAQYIFWDGNRLEREDKSEGNTSGEERWQTLGLVGKTLFVAYTERGNTKRIITARVATKKERRSYNGYYRIDGEGWTKAT
ncbi:membrane protein [Spirochaetia bacterium]|nr:membrane protein [Spirochaetia bacterium]